MKLEIFGEPKETEPVLRLKLTKDIFGDIWLHAVNEDGNNIQNLLRIAPSGTITRSPIGIDFAKKYLLDVDDQDRMRIS